MRAGEAYFTGVRLGQRADPNPCLPLLVLGRTPLALTLGALPLGLKPALARGRGGARGATVLGNSQRARKPLNQSGQGQLPITSLRALVLSDRHHPRANTREDPIPLCLA